MQSTTKKLNKLNQFVIIQIHQHQRYEKWKEEKTSTCRTQTAQGRHGHYDQQQVVKCNIPYQLRISPSNVPFEDSYYQWQQQRRI